MFCMKKLSGPKKKLGARGHCTLLEHSPEFGGELETTHSLQLNKTKQKNGFLKAMYPTALLSPTNLYKLMQYKVNPNKQGGIGWDIRAIHTRNKH